MIIGFQEKLRCAADALKQDIRDKRVNDIAYRSLRKELSGLGFDVSLWNRQDLLEGGAPVVFEGRPYDVKKKGPDIILEEGSTDKIVAEFKNALSPSNMDEFVKNVKDHTERLSSMYQPVTLRIRFAAALLQKGATLAPEMLEAMKEYAPKLVDMLTKKNIIPKGKEQEAVKEIMRARIPAQNIPKIGP